MKKYILSTLISSVVLVACSTSNPNITTQRAKNIICESDCYATNYKVNIFPNIIIYSINQKDFESQNNYIIDLNSEYLKSNPKAVITLVSYNNFVTGTKKAKRVNSKNKQLQIVELEDLSTQFIKKGVNPNQIILKPFQLNEAYWNINLYYLGESKINGYSDRNTNYKGKLIYTKNKSERSNYSEKELFLEYPLINQESIEKIKIK